MGVIVAFDLGDQASFASTKEWIAEVKRENGSEFALFLVGLKSDTYVLQSSAGLLYLVAAHGFR